MLSFIFGISFCFNIIFILLIFFYFKIKSRKTKRLNKLDKEIENWLNEDTDLEKKFDRFLKF